MSLAHVVISGEGRHDSKVVVDGVDVSKTLVGVDVHLDPRDVPVVTLTHLAVLSYSGQAEVGHRIRLYNVSELRDAAALPSVVLELRALASELEAR